MLARREDRRKALKTMLFYCRKIYVLYAKPNLDLIILSIVCPAKFTLLSIVYLRFYLNFHTGGRCHLCCY